MNASVTPIPVHAASLLRRMAYGVALLLGVALAQSTWAAAPFSVNTDGTVLDSSTSLLWDQCPYGRSGSNCATGTPFYGTWQAALAAAVAANAANYKGFNDWRVPNRNELESLTQLGNYNSRVPAIDTAAFPGTPADWFWTSTSYAPDPTIAWHVDFSVGDAMAYATSNPVYVRLVRSGQPSAAFDSISTPKATGALNDTGITFCGDASTNTANCAAVAADGGTFPRQDARYGRDAQAAAGTLTKVGGGGKGFDYSKIANNGTVLPASAALGTGATDWACTRDNVTGLIWEVKTTSGLRSQSHTYTWYDSNPATNGGAVGTASGGTCFATGRCDTEKFTADVNAAALCGASDWRMPRVKELEGIADFGQIYPAIDPFYFPNTDRSTAIFWSSSPLVGEPTLAWVVYFYFGFAYTGGGRSIGHFVRLVRAAQ